MADKKNWRRLLLYVTGPSIKSCCCGEYLAAENHIVKSQIKGRLRLSDGERATLAGTAKRLGRKSYKTGFATAGAAESSELVRQALFKFLEAGYRLPLDAGGRPEEARKQGATSAQRLHIGGLVTRFASLISTRNVVLNPLKRPS